MWHSCVGANICVASQRVIMEIFRALIETRDKIRLEFTRANIGSLFTKYADRVGARQL